jgi:hypothetical protein
MLTEGDAYSLFAAAPPTVENLFEVAALLQYDYFDFAPLYCGTLNIETINIILERLTLKVARILLPIENLWQLPGFGPFFMQI